MPTSRQAQLDTTIWPEAFGLLAVRAKKKYQDALFEACLDSDSPQDPEQLSDLSSVCMTSHNSNWRGGAILRRLDGGETVGAMIWESKKRHGPHYVLVRWYTELIAISLMDGSAILVDSSGRSSEYLVNVGSWDFSIVPLEATACSLELAGSLNERKLSLQVTVGQQQPSSLCTAPAVESVRTLLVDVVRSMLPGRRSGGLTPMDRWERIATESVVGPAPLNAQILALYTLAVCCIKRHMFFASSSGDSCGGIA